MHDRNVKGAAEIKKEDTRYFVPPDKRLTYVDVPFFDDLLVFNQ